jgi:glycosyltransferase involved in cell wall biosynthesis
VPWLVELLKRLRAQDVDVEVLTSSYRGLGDQSFEGIPVHRFRYFPARWENLTHDEAAPDRMRRSLLYKLAPAFFVLFGVIAAWRLARRRRYDIIHIHWPLPLALLGWAAARASGAPRVTLFYGVELRLVARAFPALRGFLRWAIRRSERVVAISRYTADEVRALVARDVEVIPYTYELAAAPQRVDREEVREPTILFVGRLVERKGVPVLVDAVAELRGETPARLVIVGDGPERAAIERRAAERGIADAVEVRGQVSDEALLGAYAGADVFVLPAIVDSRGDTEGLGVVLLEAMNFGLPVVGSAVGGILDIVVPGESGMLVPPGDSAALADALRRLLGDPALARRLGDAGRERVRTHFSWARIVSRWIQLYRSLVPASRM